MTRVVLVKLGGSLITDKTRPRTARPHMIRRLTAEVARACRRHPELRVVLGHGSGSFGHATAASFGLDRGVRQDNVVGVSATQLQARALHQIVLDSCLSAGLHPFSLPPASWMVADGGRPADTFLAPLALALRGSFLPVVFGDVVSDRAETATICSTEAAFWALVRDLPSEGFRVAEVLWMGDTPGVWDPRGRILAELRTEDLERLELGQGPGVDVTGGMMLRVHTTLAFARRGVSSWILDGRTPSRLEQALGGERVEGTRVPPQGEPDDG